jgi:hypothetical protein
MYGNTSKWSMIMHYYPGCGSLHFDLSVYTFDLSATSQQYFSLTTNQPPATSQQYYSLRTNQHQSWAASQPNRLPVRLALSGLLSCCSGPPRWRWGVVVDHPTGGHLRTTCLLGSLPGPPTWSPPPVAVMTGLYVLVAKQVLGGELATCSSVGLAIATWSRSFWPLIGSCATSDLIRCVRFAFLENRKVEMLIKKIEMDARFYFPSDWILTGIDKC